MKLTILPAAPMTMRPLISEVSTFKVAGRSIADWHTARAAERLPEDAGLELDAAFWPSDAMWKIFAGVCGVLRVTAGGATVATVRRGCGQEHLLEADENSRLLRWPWELIELNEALMADWTESQILGTVSPRATIEGVVVLGAGSVILPGVYIEGNAVFGENCKIGPNCYIRGCTSVGDKCHIGQAVEIKNSVLQDRVSVGHLSYVGDSVIGARVNFGAGTVTSNLRHDGKNHKWLSPELGWVDTGRRKFGAVIGEDVHTGIHTSIYPGRAIPAGSAIRPGTVVEK